MLLEDFCQQFPSHSIGTLAFGPDGMLYLSAGEGAHFDYADFGQIGNVCGDPPNATGTSACRTPRAARCAPSPTGARPASP